MTLSIPHCRAAVVAISALWLGACASTRMAPPAQPGHAAATMRPYEVDGHWYRPSEQPHYDAVGLATWYGPHYACHATADGEALDPAALTGAHKTLPLPSIVEVTNLQNGRRIRVRLNDRGPFAPGRIIDLTPAAAKQLGFYSQGLARVRVRYVGPAPHADRDCR